jgi:histidinol-phosphate aminotransferase
LINICFGVNDMPSPRPTINTLPPTIHGARDYAELVRLGLNPDDVIDFSTNSNPFGPHPAVIEAVRQAMSAPTLRRYPDRDCLSLRAAIAAADDIPLDHILPGNGATELIHLIALTFVKPDTCHLVLSPTFGEYAHAIRVMGGNVYEHRPQTHTNLTLDTDDVLTIIRRIQPDSIWLCNPNNPTGQYWSSDELVLLRTADPDDEILWVVDEAYRHFVDQPQDSDTWSEGKNVIRLRSLTKDYNLAGLRLGYILAGPELIQPMRIAQPPWSVNALAQVAAIAALQQDVLAWRQQSLAQLHQLAAELWVGLDSLGLLVSPSATPFALVTVDNATIFRSRLLSRGLLVRDCTSFGLPRYIRIAAHRPEANRSLLLGIEKLLAAAI